MPPELASLIELSPASRCKLERHLEEDFQVLDLLYQHGLTANAYTRTCDMREAGRDIEEQRALRTADTIGCHSCQAIYDHLIKGDLYT